MARTKQSAVKANFAHLHPRRQVIATKIARKSSPVTVPLRGLRALRV